MTASVSTYTVRMIEKDIQRVGNGRPSEAPAIFRSEHRNCLARASPAVPNKLRFVENDAVESGAREDAASNYVRICGVVANKLLWTHPCIRSQFISSPLSRSSGAEKSRLRV